MTLYKTLQNIGFAVLYWVFQFHFASAQGVTALQTPTPKVGTLFDFIVIVLGIVIKIGIPVVTVFLIYAGFLFLTAQGDTTKIQLARQIFFWTFIGAGILLGAVVLANAIHGTMEEITG
jgi:hypothetical protein